MSLEVSCLSVHEADMRATGDQGWTRVGFGCLDSPVYCFDIIAVFYGLGMPIVRGETCCPIFAERHIRRTVNRNVIIIVKENQSPQL